MKRSPVIRGMIFQPRGKTNARNMGKINNPAMSHEDKYFSLHEGPGDSRGYWKCLVRHRLCIVTGNPMRVIIAGSPVAWNPMCAIRTGRYYTGAEPCGQYNSDE